MAADPLPSHRPPEIICPQAAWYVEGGGLEIETGYCNYINLYQPALAAVAVGDSLHLVLWHDRLVADAPATGHVAVWAAGQLLWEREVAIPAQAAIFDVTWPALVPVPKNAPIVLHLHNHGYNTWKVATLEVGVQLRAP